MNTLFDNQEDLTELAKWLEAVEGEHFEFKEAKEKFDFKELCRYASALANEGGGRVVFGVTDKRPRKVVGSEAFAQPEETRKNLNDKIRLPTSFKVISHGNGRVLAFEIPAHPIGIATTDGFGRAWMRDDDDSLIPLSEERRRAIYDERTGDFSSETCEGFEFTDLSSKAIDAFRHEWMSDIAENTDPGSIEMRRMLQTADNRQLLEDVGALVDSRVTNAAVILFAPARLLQRRFPNAEVIFEYRSSEAPGPAADRENYKDGFFLYYNAIWERINRRNDLQHYQDGLAVRDLPTFPERPVREQIQNAVSHRNYRDPAPIFVRQYAQRIQVESPGGFPGSVTTKNVLRKSVPRNPLIANLFEKCGLVERSGQGMDLMFTSAVRYSQRLPSFDGTDESTVWVTLHGKVEDGEFVRFLRGLGDDTINQLGTDEFLVLDRVRRDERLDDDLRSAAGRLRDLGLIESTGRRQGTGYILSRKLYKAIGRTGEYTRTKGLDREHNLQLLLKHLRDAGDEGARLDELSEVLPTLSSEQVRYRLQLLKKRGDATNYGFGVGSRWWAAEHAPPPSG